MIKFKIMITFEGKRVDEYKVEHYLCIGRDELVGKSFVARLVCQPPCSITKGTSCVIDKRDFGDSASRRVGQVHSGRCGVLRCQSVSQHNILNLIGNFL